MKRGRLEGGREQPEHGRQAMDRSLERLAPLIEEGINLEGVLLGRILVGTRSNEAKDVCQGRLGRIVGLESNIGERESGLFPWHDACRTRQEGASPESSGAEQKRSKSD